VAGFHFLKKHADDRSHFGRRALIFAAVSMGIGALFHILCLIGGPKWVAFAGAPEPLIQSMYNGSYLTHMLTVLIALLLSLWGGYAASGAGLIRRLPFLKPVLWGVGIILIVRGAIIIPMLPYWNWSDPISAFHGGLSFYVLAIGLAYVFGAKALRHLTPQQKTDH